MFQFAVITILFAYSIFALGIFHILYKENVFILTSMYVMVLGFLLRKKLWFPTFFVLNVTSLQKILLFILGLLIVVNGIGVLGPETSFDALWYHLTFPKLYLLEHGIRFIPGGLLYYSVMPKLGELLFVPALAFGNEIGVKSIQFAFGILTLFAIYKLSRLYFSVTLSLLAVIVFYSNIVVAWESTVAYIDLIRAFFELLALYAFLLWYEKKKLKWLIVSALMVGGAMSTKLLALGSLGIFIILILVVNLQQKKTLKRIIGEMVLFIGISMFVVFPWLGFSYSTTGNPVYPFFTDIYKTHIDTAIFSVAGFIKDFITLFIFADDPISPLYFIILPLVLISCKKLSFPLKIIGVYVLIALLLWYMTPRTGGGRFILPYLPAFSILAIAIIDLYRKQKIIYTSLILCVISIACITIVYRGLANARYLPVILGKETKQSYLTTHLNFSFGDFYDTDGYFKKHIKPTDTVLLFGFHNLYYIDFPFIDSSWVKKGNKFTYVATQNTTLPRRFKEWDLVYENPKTFVRLYKKGSKQWEY